MTTSPRTTTLTIFGAIGSAFAASLCCTVPLLLLALGTGGAWASRLSFLEPYRPLMYGVTLMFVAIAFFSVYRRTNGACDCGSSTRRTRAVVWVMALVVAALLAGPHFLPRLLASTGPSDEKPGSAMTANCCPAPSSSTVAPAQRPAFTQRILPIDPSKEIVFKVGHLGCPLVGGVGCGHLLAPALAQIDGIEGVSRSYTNWTGTELRISAAPNADVAAVAERVRTFLAADHQEPARVEGDALAKSLNDQEWRGVENVVDLTTFEFHTFARQQVGAFADAQKFEPKKKEKLIALVDASWDKAAKDLGFPRPEAEKYAAYWQARLQKLADIFEDDADGLLTREQIVELLNKYRQRVR